VHGGREIDFVLHAADRILLLEVKAGTGIRAADVRVLGEAVESVRLPGVRPKARRLGLIVTRGREVERLAPRVWAVPYWRLFGPGE
jgi:predicted AAA+ superfamily ATPase